MRECDKCKGRGYIPEYKSYNNGICYKCSGVRYLFKNPEEKEEYFRVKGLFEQEISLDIDIKDYFNMPKEEREEFIKYTERDIAHEREMIECSKRDIAAEAGFDSYEEYENEMRYEHMDDPYSFY